MAFNKKDLAATYSLAGIAENGTPLEARVEKILGEFYVKVASVDGGKAGGKATVLFMQDAGDEKVVSFVREYTLPLSIANGSDNFIAQAYKHLKTLPEFAAAVDC